MKAAKREEPKMTNDRNYQLQGSYTRYCDGYHTGFDSESGPYKFRNFKTIENAIKAAKKELKRNDNPKVARREAYKDERGMTWHRWYSEDGREVHWSDGYEVWHVDGMRVVDRETQKVLWEA